MVLKRQNTVKSSTFGSEFVALKIAVERNIALRHKIRVMGIPIEELTSTFGDDSGVVANVTVPESTLQKRHNAIAYHKRRKKCAAGAICLLKKVRRIAAMV
jgi:hypothetical protein